MHRLVLVIAVLSGCGGFELDAHIRGRPGHTTLIVDGREVPSLDGHWSFPTFVDALRTPATIRLNDPDGRAREVVLNVLPCFSDGDDDWEHGDFDYELTFFVDGDGHSELLAGVRSASCTIGDRGVTIIVD